MTFVNINADTIINTDQIVSISIQKRNFNKTHEVVLYMGDSQVFTIVTGTPTTLLREMGL